MLAMGVTYALNLGYVVSLQITFLLSVISYPLNISWSTYRNKNYVVHTKN